MIGRRMAAGADRLIRDQGVPAAEICCFARDLG